jgi:hypothetical protein
MKSVQSFFYVSPVLVFGDDTENPPPCGEGLSALRRGLFGHCGDVKVSAGCLSAVGDGYRLFLEPEPDDLAHGFFAGFGVTVIVVKTPVGVGLITPLVVSLFRVVVPDHDSGRGNRATVGGVGVPCFDNVCSHFCFSYGVGSTVSQYI